MYALCVWYIFVSVWVCVPICIHAKARAAYGVSSCTTLPTCLQTILKIWGKVTDQRALGLFLTLRLPMLVLQECTAIPGFFFNMSAKDSNSGLHALLPRSHLLAPGKLFFFNNLVACWLILN